MNRTLSIIVLLQLVACGKVSEDRWESKSFKISCKTLRRCDPITYHYRYDSLGTCVDSTTAETQGCRYDPKAARRCVRAMRWNCAKIGRRYDDYLERCGSVWDCDDAGTTDTAVTSQTSIP